jgi:hypothetical protein
LVSNPTSALRQALSGVGVAQRPCALARTREPAIGLGGVAGADRPQADQQRRPWRARVAVVERFEQRAGTRAIAAVVVPQRLAEQARAVVVCGVHVGVADAIALVDPRTAAGWPGAQNEREHDHGERDQGSAVPACTTTIARSPGLDRRGWRWNGRDGHRRRVVRDVGRRRVDAGGDRRRWRVDRRGGLALHLCIEADADAAHGDDALAMRAEYGARAEDRLGQRFVGNDLPARPQSRAEFVAREHAAGGLAQRQQQVERAPRHRALARADEHATALRLDHDVGEAIAAGGHLGDSCAHRSS